jgi:hypothetical protein
MGVGGQAATTLLSSRATLWSSGRIPHYRAAPPLTFERSASGEGVGCER